MIFNHKMYDVKNNKNAFRLISKEEYNSPVKTIFNIEKIRYKNNGNYYELNNDTACLIYLMTDGLIGFNKITEYNYISVFKRINILERIIFNQSFIKNVNPITNKISNFYFTEAMVKKNIGTITKNKTFIYKTFIKMCIDYKLKI